MQDMLREALAAYGITESAVPFGNGHVNNTYLLPQTGAVLQRINTAAFHRPAEVMDNMLAVTDFLRRKAKASGEDAARATLTILPTIDGKPYYSPTPDICYRLCKLVDGVCYDSVADNAMLSRAGEAFGKFQNMLSDFPAETLYETIPHFHDTPARIDALRTAANTDLVGRAAEVEKELAFAMARADEMDVVTRGLADGSIPLRVTHNDTKLNNVIFDRESGAPLAVIDLDTVMSGSMLYDFGDAVRFGASSAAEDEKDLAKVQVDLAKFEAFTRGYLTTVHDTITARELELLPYAARLITYECGIRFLTDYLNGDTYFRIHYPTQNLDRARTQLKLVADMEAKTGEMERIVARLWAWSATPLQ